MYAKSCRAQAQAHPFIIIPQSAVSDTIYFLTFFLLFEYPVEVLHHIFHTREVGEKETEMCVVRGGG